MKINIDSFAKSMGLEAKDIRGLYTTFFSEMNESIILLKKSAKEKDYITINNLVHNMKGVCLNLELTELGNYVKQCYEEFKAGNYSNLEDLILYFDSEIKLIFEIVSDYYADK